MDVNALADELVLALKTVPALHNRVDKGDPGSVDPPCAAVWLPDEIEFDATYGRGADRMTWRFAVLLGRSDSNEGRLIERAGPLADGSGTNSVKARLQAYPFTAAHSVHVRRAEFAILRYGTIDYQGIVFEADIFGSGSA